MSTMTSVNDSYIERMQRSIDAYQQVMHEPLDVRHTITMLREIIKIVHKPMLRLVDNIDPTGSPRSPHPHLSTRADRLKAAQEELAEVYRVADQLLGYDRIERAQAFLSRLEQAFEKREWIEAPPEPVKEERIGKPTFRTVQR